MPTIEERLAALETKLAALTETTPTTYYEHQYSGEEIDNAVSRALPNGAIDQSVGTFVRPNLLDNAYFLNPVDQRGGYIVPKGVNYYKVDGWVLQGPIPETVRVDYIDESGSARFDYGGVPCYVPKDGGYVRGYTGNGYTVDRWGILNNVTATLQNASLNIAYTESGWNLYTFLDNVLMPGTTYTLSCLYKASGNPIRLVCTWGTNKFFYNEQAPISDDWTLAEITGTIPADATIDTNEIVVQSLGSGAGNFSLKAIKLELGPTQTLAHQENGQWVLNEMPEYGEQLRRCQRYCFVWGYSAKQTSCLAVMQAYEPERLFGLIPTPVTMRATPVVTGGSLTTFGGMVTSLWSLNLCANGIRAVASVNGAKFVVGQAVGIENADDNGRVIFSADL